jgi:predicted regulator of Ras-like GTPase activity (Roadblock/LC7/MglB family)
MELGLESDKDAARNLAAVIEAEPIAPPRRGSGLLAFLRGMVSPSRPVGDDSLLDYFGNAMKLTPPRRMEIKRIAAAPRGVVDPASDAFASEHVGGIREPDALVSAKREQDVTETESPASALEGEVSEFGAPAGAAREMAANLFAAGETTPPAPERTIRQSDPVSHSASEVAETTKAKEPPMSRRDEFLRILRKLQSDTAGVESAALISPDGLVVASVMPSDMEDERVGGMAATLLNLGTRASVELGRDQVREVVVQGAGGYVVLMQAQDSLLLVISNEGSKLGLLFFEMRQAIAALRKFL